MPNRLVALAVGPLLLATVLLAGRSTSAAAGTAPQVGSLSAASADGDMALRFVKAQFAGDLTTFNQLSCCPKARQEDLDADHARKHTLAGMPILHGVPKTLPNGDVVYEVMVKVKSPAGQDVRWTEDVTVSAVSHRVIKTATYTGQSGGNE